MGNIQLTIGALADRGGRDYQEDAHWWADPYESGYDYARKGYLFIVADGVGGYEAGEVASGLAVQVIPQRYYSHPSPDVLDALADAILAANREIYQRAGGNAQGMGTTVACAVVRGREVYVAHAGDSRVYLLHRQQLYRLTEDHSWVAEEVRAGRLTEDEALVHPRRNVITRALGKKPRVDPDVFQFAEPVERGDVLFLCTDGLYDVVSESDIQYGLLQHEPQAACEELINQAKVNSAVDNLDNLTALVVALEPEQGVTNDTEPEAVSGGEASGDYLDDAGIQQAQVREDVP
jgi:serine/threonine protein phosphatase PrpC